MGTFITLLIVVILYLIGRNILKRRMESYDMSKVDNQKLFQDVMDKKTKREIETKLTSGQYDKDE